MRRLPLLVALAGLSVIGLALAAPPAAAETNCSTSLPNGTTILLDCGTNAGPAGAGFTIGSDCANARVFTPVTPFWVIGDQYCPA